MENTHDNPNGSELKIIWDFCFNARDLKSSNPKRDMYSIFLYEIEGKRVLESSLGVDFRAYNSKMNMYYEKILDVKTIGNALSFYGSNFLAEINPKNIPDLLSRLFPEDQLDGNGLHKDNPSRLRDIANGLYPTPRGVDTRVYKEKFMELGRRIGKAVHEFHRFKVYENKVISASYFRFCHEHKAYTIIGEGENELIQIFLFLNKTEIWGFRKLVKAGMDSELSKLALKDFTDNYLTLRYTFNLRSGKREKD